MHYRCRQLLREVLQRLVTLHRSLVKQGPYDRSLGLILLISEMCHCNPRWRLDGVLMEGRSLQSSLDISCRGRIWSCCSHLIRPREPLQLSVRCVPIGAFWRLQFFRPFRGLFSVVSTPTFAIEKASFAASFKLFKIIGTLFQIYANYIIRTFAQLKKYISVQFRRGISFCKIRQIWH